MNQIRHWEIIRYSKLRIYINQGIVKLDLHMLRNFMRLHH